MCQLTIRAILTLPAFHAWVKTQPPDENFNYCHVSECAIAQYLKANGVEHPDVRPNSANGIAIPDDLRSAMLAMLASGDDQRMGHYRWRSLEKHLHNVLEAPKPQE